MSRQDDFLTFLAPSGIRSSALPAGLFLLITDALEAPGTFLLSHFVAKAVRDGRRTVFLGLSQSFDHYSAILKKTGVQLATARDKGVFTYIDAPPTSHDTLRLLSDALIPALEGAEQPLVVIDDVSSLQWSGQSVQDVARFVAGLRAVISNVGGSLVVLQHGDDLASPDSDDSALFRRLFQRSDLWLHTTVLSSQTRGELAIHRGPALAEDWGVVDRSGATALQYKLEEGGAVFHVKGLGKGFL
ncbi:UPF0405 domain protein [Pseudohyphozyma bogoriensis]|nr:UPF0405 domain protein [Pseudohyphozyma bogoriensis]